MTAFTVSNGCFSGTMSARPAACSLGTSSSVENPAEVFRSLILPGTVPDVRTD